jgi:hypothetical protein
MRAPELRIFPEAGYAFVRGVEGARGFHLTFDFGRFSRCAAANHAHCDALSFELYAGGRALVVDPGVFLPWGEDERWTRYFRSTAAHNTLVVDGREQSEICAYADVRREAQTGLLGHSVIDGRARVSAECTPYWAVDEEICHRREICCEMGGTLRIRDRVMGKGQHRLEWSFHFAPGIDAQKGEAGTVAGKLADEEVEIFTLKVLADYEPDLVLARGETDPLRGWVAQQSSQVAPAFVAVYTVDVDLPFEIEFCLALMTPEHAEDAPADSDQLLHAPTR